MKWTTAFGQAVRANPSLAAMLAFELGLMVYAACKARRGEPAGVHQAQAFSSALPFIAIATGRRKKR